MILKSIFVCCISLVSLVVLCDCSPPTNTTINGFTTYLIHRDSPQSPFYDPSTTPWQRLASAVERSHNRAKRVTENLQKATPHSMVTPGDGDYLMRLSLGTPVTSIIAVADTGSDLIWTQCQPCHKCFPQRRANFEPQYSSTYKPITCSSHLCTSVQKTTCDRSSGNCIYLVLYADGSSSRGPLATETFYMGSDAGERLAFPNIVFGCGDTNTDKFDSGGSGIVGLGGGSASLVRQLGYDKFSYCLMPFSERDKSSMMHFGADGDVSGVGVVTTPISERSPASHYYLTLEGISVGDRRLEFHNPFLMDGVGNIVIDSGTTMTLLPQNFYEELEQAVVSSIRLSPVRNMRGWRLCYYSKGDIVIPKMVVHFEEADVEWQHYNAFVRVNQAYVCFATEPLQGVPIYGGVAQANFLVGYDLTRSVLSFKPTQCG